MSNNSSINDDDDEDDNFLRGIHAARIDIDYDSDDEDADERRPYDPTDASDPFSRHVVPPIPPVTITEIPPQEEGMDVDEDAMDVHKYDDVKGGKSTKRRKTNRRRRSTNRRKTNRHTRK